MNSYPQWITCPGYRDISALTVTAGRNRVLPLMTMPDYSLVDPAALEDDALVDDFIVKRVCGEICPVFVNTNVTQMWGWRLMSLPWDYAGSAFDVPWTVTDSPLRSSDITNMPRWWAERWWQLTAAVAGDANGRITIDHPYWTQVDIHPNAVCGPQHGNGMFPCLVVDNTLGAVDLQVYHGLRLLVEVSARR